MKKSLIISAFAALSMVAMSASANTVTVTRTVTTLAQNVRQAANTLGMTAPANSALAAVVNNSQLKNGMSFEQNLQVSFNKHKIYHIAKYSQIINSGVLANLSKGNQRVPLADGGSASAAEVVEGVAAMLMAVAGFSDKEIPNTIEDASAELGIAFLNQNKAQQNYFKNISVEATDAEEKTLLRAMMKYASAGSIFNALSGKANLPRQAFEKGIEIPVVFNKARAAAENAVKAAQQALGNATNATNVAVACAM